MTIIPASICQVQYAIRYLKMREMKALLHVHWELSPHTRPKKNLDVYKYLQTILEVYNIIKIIFVMVKYFPAIF